MSFETKLETEKEKELESALYYVMNIPFDAVRPHSGSFKICEWFIPKRSLIINVGQSDGRLYSVAKPTINVFEAKLRWNKKQCENDAQEVLIPTFWIESYLAHRKQKLELAEAEKRMVETAPLPIVITLKS